MANEIYEFQNNKNIYLPKTCPHCNREILPKVISEYRAGLSGSLFCSCDLCKKTFLIYVEKLYKSPRFSNIVIYPRSKVIKVINEFLNFEPLNLLLEASNIIGNDETHYEKRYDELSVEELIQFINSIIKYIDYEHSISQAHNVVIQHHSDTPKNQQLHKDT